MVAAAFGLFVLALGLFASRLRRRSLLRRGKLDAGTAGLREADRDRLLRRPCAVLAFANVFDLLAHKFASLCGSRFSFPFVLPYALDCFLLRHLSSLRPRGSRTCAQAHSI